MEGANCPSTTSTTSTTSEDCSSVENPVEQIRAPREDDTVEPEELRPPLPPRPEILDLLNEGNTLLTTPKRLNLQSHATTAVSLTDINGQTNAEGRNGFVAGLGRVMLGSGLRAKASLSQLNSARGSDSADAVSVSSYVPKSVDSPDDSLFGEFAADENATGNAVDNPKRSDVLNLDEYPQDGSEEGFADEFEPIGELQEDSSSEGKRMRLIQETRNI